MPDQQASRGRILAIGDIHGCLTALEKLDRELAFSDADTVIALGDYIDRGPDSCGVIDYLLDLRQRCNLVALRGNHEVLLQRALADPSSLDHWLENGGNTTLDSYGAKSPKRIPGRHKSFIDETELIHELSDDFFVHASVLPDRPLQHQPDQVMLWQRLEEPQPHRSGKRMICGHTSQKSGDPLNLGHTLCIDTWVYGDGWLTCLDVRNNHFWQANRRGQFRRRALERAS